MNHALDPATVESHSLAAQPVVSIRAVVPPTQLAVVMGARTGALFGYVRLRAQGRAAAGPPWEIYHWFDRRQDPAKQNRSQWRAQLV